MTNPTIITPNGREAFLPDVVILDTKALEQESARILRIRNDIENITYLPAALAGKGSADITLALARLEMLTITREQFGEMCHEAAMARDTTISALLELREANVKKEQSDSSMEADRAKQDVQRQNAMRMIREMQDFMHTNGSAAVLMHVMESVAATSILDEEYGIGTEAVKNAQTMALDTLRPKYERAVIDESTRQLHDIADELIDEASASDDEIVLAVAHHFGWSREKAKSRLICIDFEKVKP